MVYEDNVFNRHMTNAQWMLVVLVLVFVGAVSWQYLQKITHSSQDLSVPTVQSVLPETIEAHQLHLIGATVYGCMNFSILRSNVNEGFDYKADPAERTCALVDVRRLAQPIQMFYQEPMYVLSGEGRALAHRTAYYFRAHLCGVRFYFVPSYSPPELVMLDKDRRPQNLPRTLHPFKCR